jgi:integrase
MMGSYAEDRTGMAVPAVPHGMRSTFRDWVAERTSFPNQAAALALAHVVSDAVEAAYRRRDMYRKRLSMMQQWADFCHGI